MDRMNRTQIYLDSDLAAALDRTARKRGVSRAALIRLAARRFLEQETAGEEDAIFGIVGLGASAPGQDCTDHDEILAERVLADRA